MKRMIFVITLLFAIQITAQEQLPEGWDKIILEGKEAYMNLVTGEVSETRPRAKASKPMKKVEVDPSIYHKVQKGETLFAIARKYNIHISEIYRLNSGFDYDNIKIGQEIIVGYDKSKEGQVEYVEEEKSYTDPSNNSVHYVKKGETLFSIAKKYNLEVSDLRKYNNLKSNEIEIGQPIKIQY